MSAYHGECTNQASASSGACRKAIFSFCRQEGFTSGWGAIENDASRIYFVCTDFAETLVRSGIGGYISAPIGYCTLSSGKHLQQCTYSQAEYDAAPQVDLTTLGTHLGVCNCPTAETLFRSSSSGYLARGEGHCYLQSLTHLQQCGYTQAQFDSAPEKNPATMGKPLGACICN